MPPTFTDADACAAKLAYGISQCVLYNQQWRTFGFRGTPRRGRIWDIFINAERRTLEAFLIREFAIVALATTCLSLKTRTHERWHLPVLARILSILLDDKRIRESFWFDSLEDALSYFVTGAKAYLAEDAHSWNEVLLKRTPRFKNDKYNAGVFLGAALLLEPTKSIFPHVSTSSINICSEGLLDGRVKLDPSSGELLLHSAESILHIVPKSAQ